MSNSSSRDHAPTTGSALEKKPSEVLQAAAALIEPEGKWTQQVLARDATGRDITIDFEADLQSAACFCLEGACRAVAPDQAFGPVNEFLKRVVNQDPWRWNDRRGRKQPEVVAALRKAAELARSEGQ